MEVFGKPKFKKGLEELGYKVQELKDNRLAIDYEIKDGRFKGQKISVGIDVPVDFEVTPPSGPHISPRLLPINPSGADHATRAHDSPGFGDEWEYLSRPIQSWQSGRSVKKYMRYVTHLLDTL